MEPLVNSVSDRESSTNLPSEPSLENLPAEIKILILRALPDTSALRALIRSSPSYHAVYLTQRQQTLFSVLLNTLAPSTLFLSYALEEVSLIHEMRHGEESWEGFDDIYLFKKNFSPYLMQQLMVRPPNYWKPNTDLDTLISICRRHWLIRSAASQYSAQKLSINPMTQETIAKFDPLTREESRRLERALYHFEMFCCLFSSVHVGETLRNENADNRLPYHEEHVILSAYEYGLSKRYLLLIDVADAEGVACLREYFFDFYTNVMSSTCKAELQRLETSPPDWMPHLEEPPHLRYEGISREDKKKEYWMSLGLRFFQQVSQAPTAEAQAQLLYQNPWTRAQFLSQAVFGECLIPDHRHCAAHPQGYDHQLHPERGSRLAPWWRTWHRGFANHDRVYLQGFGYAFWDQQRLDSWRMTESQNCV